MSIPLWNFHFPLIGLTLIPNAEVKISVKGQTTDAKAQEVTSKKEEPAAQAEAAAEPAAEEKAE